MTSTATHAKPRRMTDVLILAVVLACVAAAAYFQEPLLYFFKLQMWDQAAPTRTVNGFVEALQAGDQQRADRYIGSAQIQPRVKGGKWAGYHIDGLGFQNDMELADLVPKSNAAPARVEYSFLEGGSANVRSTNTRGKPVTYTVKRLKGAWKVVSLRVGA